MMPPFNELLAAQEPALQGVVARILEFLPPYAGRVRIFFTGCSTGDGATVVATACAQALARTPGQHVVLIEADRQSSALAALLGLPRGPGLADVLAGRASVIEALREGPLPQLSVLVGGGLDSRAEGEISPDRIEAVLDAAQREAALQESPPRSILTLIDAPPILDHPWLRPWLSSCHGAVLVLRSGATRLSRARSAVRILGSAGVEVLGTVMNRFSPAFPFGDDPSLSG